MRIPWRYFPRQDGTQVARPVVHCGFPATGQTETLLLDSGADVSLAPASLADDLGLDWRSGAFMKLKGISPRRECDVEARLMEVEVVVLRSGWRFRVPFCFAEGDAPVLAGRKGFLDRLEVRLSGPTRSTQLHYRG